MELPKFRAAAVQAAPVFLDAAATVEKACGLIREAADRGAALVAFPEVFVPGYPYWNWTMPPPQAGPFFERLVLASIEVPGPEVDALCRAAREHAVHVVIGVNERHSQSLGTLYNSVLIIDSGGVLRGVHRKLVPTWAEKLTWAGGDGSSLRVYDTDIGPLGVLACGENTNPLARFSLLAQGELVHIANYIALPVAPDDYDMVEAIRLRAAANSFEGKVFTVVSCSTISAEIADAVAHDEASRAALSRPHCAFSGIFGPDGRLLSDPLVDDEGIVLADIDLRRCIQAKQMHDITGGYNRFDVFRLEVDQRSQQSLWLHPAAAGPDPRRDLSPGIPEAADRALSAPPVSINGLGMLAEASGQEP